MDYTDKGLKRLAREIAGFFHRRGVSVYDQLRVLQMLTADAITKAEEKSKLFTAAWFSRGVKRIINDIKNKNND